MQQYSAIGVMSGSSLDGIDLARCTFQLDEGRWAYRITEARTVPYDDVMRDRLHDVMDGSALDLARLHRDLGDMIGRACRDVIGSGKVDLIGSHGHTIFHKPDEGLTTQVGCGARIAAITGTTTVCDFRTTDVALGGQGAPLVPLGEKLLFPEYQAFLNIGGICNIALHDADPATGYDVCIGNQALNFLAEKVGRSFDQDGTIARSGSVDLDLLDRLNALPFHHRPPPRSLGREWFDEQLKPLISENTLSVADRLRTTAEHIAQQLTNALIDSNRVTLVTGGGAHNSFLMELLSAHSANTYVVPGKLAVDHKEALIFAFLGVLRMRNRTTALASITGARRDSIGGAVYQAN